MYIWNPDKPGDRLDLSAHDESRARSLSFRTASVGVLTPRCNQSRTFVTVNVCLTELRTSTSNCVSPPGSRSCFRKAARPSTDASYKPSASTSTECLIPSKSTNDTVQAAMMPENSIFANFRQSDDVPFMAQKCFAGLAEENSSHRLRTTAVLTHFLLVAHAFDPVVPRTEAAVEVGTALRIRSPPDRRGPVPVQKTVGTNPQN